jgi:hypothetical protein
MQIARRPFLVIAGFGLLLGPSLARAADRIAGSGHAAAQRRELGPFSAVALEASFAVVLRPASRASVEVTADDNLLPYIETRIRDTGGDRSLEIGLRRDVEIDPRTPILVSVDLVRLDAVALDGSGTITGQGLKSPRLNVAIGGSGRIALAAIDVDELAVAVDGSGRMRADGRARKVALAMNGSGRCDLERVIAGDVSVTVAGSGECRVHADGALSVSIAGSGDVYYRGSAVPTVANVGSGRVKPL